MTERIYYTDPARRTFDALVTGTLLHENRPAIVLDRTAFYPTSGGQPYDTGTLAVIAAPGSDGESLSRCRVVDVVDSETEILHVVDRLIAPGTAVRGEIDWVRRFDHMQQHTGQHVLSAAFADGFHNATVSFHLGSETSSIDLAREATTEELRAAEDAANRVIWEDRPVTVRFVDSETASTLPLRKPPPRAGMLRLIEVEGVDLSACGGTHVARTGAIGMVAIAGVERFKGGSRVTFVCGGRSLAAWRTARQALEGSIRHLSVLPQELPGTIERLQGDARQQRKLLADVRERLAAYEGRALAEHAPSIGGIGVVIRTLPDADALTMKAMANAAVAHAPSIVALITGSVPRQIVIARSTGVAADANSLIREVFARFGGKGGGKPDLAQGGGLTVPSENVETFVSTLIRAVLDGR